MTSSNLMSECSFHGPNSSYLEHFIVLPMRFAVHPTKVCLQLRHDTFLLGTVDAY